MRSAWVGLFAIEHFVTGRVNYLVRQALSAPATTSRLLAGVQLAKVGRQGQRFNSRAASRARPGSS